MNAGSLGLPHEGRPGAFWLALIDGEPSFCCTAYELSSLPADSEHMAVARGEITADEVATEFEAHAS